MFLKKKKIYIYMGFMDIDNDGYKNKCFNLKKPSPILNKVNNNKYSKETRVIKKE